MKTANSTTERRPLIAFVDDDRAVLRAMKRMAFALGLDAQTFASGCEFIDKLQKTPSFRPDCAVLTVDMPGMSGLDVLKHLKSHRYPIPVVIVTALDDGRIRDEALAHGALAVFHNPVIGDDLFILTLHSVLKSSTHPRARNLIAPI